MVSSFVPNKQLPKLILAIDTSCDETSAAVVRGVEVLSNVRYSQTQHADFGGVVPSVARFEHQQKIDGVVDEAIQKSGILKQDIQTIAVTIGPGLAIALEVGIQKAKDLATELDIPLIPVNHMEGHLLSALAGKAGSTDSEVPDIKFPALGVLISGKHSEFILVKAIGDYQKIASTVDDACGECLDKCGRMLGLKYPAGAEIGRLAAEHAHKMNVKTEKRQDKLYVVGSAYALPVPMVFNDTLDMSYSGLKTAFRRLLEGLGVYNDYEPGVEVQTSLTAQQVGELCVVLQQAAFMVLLAKLDQVVNSYSIQEIWVGGGVGASTELRKQIGALAARKGLVARIPDDINMLVDNAAMIGLAASFSNTSLLPNQLDKIQRLPGLSL